MKQVRARTIWTVKGAKLHQSEFLLTISRPELLDLGTVNSTVNTGMFHHRNSRQQFMIPQGQLSWPTQVSLECKYISIYKVRCTFLHNKK